MIPTEQHEKFCGGCRKEKPVAEFSVLRGGRISSQCKRCACDRATHHRVAAGAVGREKRRTEYARRRATDKSNVIRFTPSVRVNLFRGAKTCGECRIRKPVSEFVRLANGRLASGCNLCAAKRSKDWYYANTERALARNPINILRKQVVLKLGSRCANPFCLVPGGCVDARALQIDHVRDDGADERKKYGNRVGPKGGQKPISRNVAAVIYSSALSDTAGRYQLLCANCNVIKEHERRQERLRQRKEAHLAAS